MFFWEPVVKCSLQIGKGTDDITFLSPKNCPEMQILTTQHSCPTDMQTVRDILSRWQLRRAAEQVDATLHFWGEESVPLLGNAGETPAVLKSKSLCTQIQTASNPTNSAQAPKGNWPPTLKRLSTFAAKNQLNHFHPVLTMVWNIWSSTQNSVTLQGKDTWTNIPYLKKWGSRSYVHSCFSLTSWLTLPRVLGTGGLGLPSSLTSTFQIL